MPRKLETPCAAPKRGLPLELKYDWAIRGWSVGNKGWLYAIRKKYGVAEALEIHDKVMKMGDRAKILTNTLRTTFNLEGNDAATIGELFDIWDEITRIDSTILERSPTINRRKVTECPWKTEPRDISDWALNFVNLITKTLNPKANLERPKAMCAGDPYCEYVWRIEESIPIKGTVKPKAKKLETPCAAPKRGISWGLKYDFVMRNYTDLFKGYLYALREKYGANAALEIFETLMKMGDRAKNLANLLRKIFNLKGNDAATIGEVFDVWDEQCGYESIILERSPTINRRKVIRCPWKVAYKDISEYAWYMKDIMGKAINPKSTLKLEKKMCAGDPYCEYIWKIEE